MKKTSDIVTEICNNLKQKDYRKPVAPMRSTLHISDDSGNTSQFAVRSPRTALLLTEKDISAVIEAMIEVIEDTLKNGEQLYIYGFGKLSLVLRKERTTKNPITKEKCLVSARYVPKYAPSNRIKSAARSYGFDTDNLFADANHRKKEDKPIDDLDDDISDDFFADEFDEESKEEFVEEPQEKKSGTIVYEDDELDDEFNLIFGGDGSGEDE